ncbi:MAG: DMT family transporter [Pseudomonadota bacterium]
MADTVAASARQNVPRAMLWMLVALASFSTVAVAGREAASAMAAAFNRDTTLMSDTLQLMLIRSVVGLICVTIAISFTRRGFGLLSPRHLPFHGLRNVVHFGAQFSWLHALTLIPLAQLFAIEFTTPLWVAALAPLFLKERLTLTRMLAAGLGFVGVLTIVQPGMSGIGLGSLLALLAALGFASSMIVTKTLTRHETALAILFHMSWMQTIMAGVLAAPWLALPDPTFLFWAVIVGFCGLTAHYGLARAFAEADAMIVAPMDFVRLPLIGVVGAVLYGETIEMAVLIGGIIVVCGNIINLLGERRRAA